ncbi:hypothetical protein H1C71_011406 [Ictidomys tridecemlineatus]|nr:hypothetical protein H1C71_011406 [Ictidomys tridecemlineatus]
MAFSSEISIILFFLVTIVSSSHGLESTNDESDDKDLRFHWTSGFFPNGTRVHPSHTGIGAAQPSPVYPAYSQGERITTKKQLTPGHNCNLISLRKHSKGAASGMPVL